MDIIRKVRDGFRTVWMHFTKPIHVEFNLSDHCNLNCASCSHYSPLAPNESIGVEALEHSMKCVAEARDSQLIREVFLMGGESLLYPHIIEAVGLARRYFPWADLQVFSNGLIVKKMSEAFWTAMREADATLSVTIYPVKFDYDDAIRFVKSKGVKVSIFSMRTDPKPFIKKPLDPGKGQWGWLNHFRCHSNGCITIDGGRIFPCSQSACVGHLNRRFNADFRWEKGDYIEVSDLRSAKELRRFMHRPVPFCKYCGKGENIAYRGSERRASEWMSEGDR